MALNDKIRALAGRGNLRKYQGRDVIRTSVAIRNAGDGLSDALGIAPEELTVGATVHVVLECEVKGHDHSLIPDTDCFELKQILKAGTATMIDSAVVADALAEQALAIKQAKDEAAGQRSSDEPEFSEANA